jgi:hypothetical protein
MILKNQGQKMLHENNSSTNPVKYFIGLVTQTFKAQWIFLIVLAVGIFARTWNFSKTPPGLNPDEASIGVEAYYLYKFGMDRNGVSYPIHLISWGSGQNVLYAYMIIPFIAAKGLNAGSIRFPMVVSGILSLPLMYYVGKRLFGEKYGLVSMFFLAISPWNIVNTRWAVESNILPFMFLAGFAFFLAAEKKGVWFIPASIFFALCLYAYGTTYVAIPAFLLLGIPAAIYLKKIDSKYINSGMLLFFVLGLPIALFILINTFKLDTIHIGSITIPRLPVEARYESLAAVFEKEPLKGVADNLAIMFNLLWTQEDDFAWNFVEPYGYFYKITFPLAALGLYFLLISFRKAGENVFERWLLLAWLISSLLIGVIHPVNLTRINLIFIPVLLCMVIGLMDLNKRIKYITPAVLIALSIAFIFFTFAYHGEKYEKRAGEVFNAGIIPAIKYASDNSSSLICISEQTRFAYIYTLFLKRFHPSEYLNQIEWLLPPDHPLDPARTPRALKMFRFKLSDCSGEPNAAFVLKLKETPPNPNIDYKVKRFIKFDVYLPKVTP